MKRMILLLTTLLILSVAGSAYAETSQGTVSLIIGDNEAQINGQSVAMAAPAQIIDGRTLVPLRFVGEAFGCDVQWNNTAQTAIVKLVNHAIEVPVSKNHAVINGVETEVQVPAQIIAGSTYVPLRFIGENLGAKVDFNSNTQTIFISIMTYLNKDQNFKMILPPEWIIDEEVSDGVRVIVPGEGYCQVAFADKGEGITPDNFSLFAGEWLKDYDGKNKLSQDIEGVIAGIVFIEDGLIQLHCIKLLDNGIFTFVGAIPETSLDANIQKQCEIALRSLNSL
ncbi:copper amine oxidase N-terminal domain-containing protein [Desulforamulus ruminis]|uniref:Copper amine oxidase-like domain-containing protein n=1 Tax=Desulforamulus ruminis (strain ATCC 23193 / DSM 2154 / NCIMB 8452 / DL) TaxID=696281 RepID=F6DPS7_DESRL|nr:copper amine oxidase N-terminal domain-containing protein [Desulforamulus ruminis]AEG60766.1 copper amine oxidase-like domain-containing protein [Desulforamulus ruminis DSM 2154]